MLGSPPWCRRGVVKLQKNHKKEKLSFRWPSGQIGCQATKSVAVHLVQVHFPIATYVKEILSRSTNTDAGEMIMPAQEKRNTINIGAWPSSLDWRPPKSVQYLLCKKKLCFKVIFDVFSRPAVQPQQFLLPTQTIFSHSRSKQFQKQNTKNK